MLDVEAVIKALRCSANDATHCFDSSCCYHEPGHACNKSKLMLDAITLLEKQPKKKKRERLLPCKCGCNRREHWYGDGESLKCKKCGFTVKGKNEADVIREWNKAVGGEANA